MRNALPSPTTRKPVVRLSTAHAMRVGAQLRWLRLEAGLTQEQIAHLKRRYLPFQDQVCVNEILRWLAGEYVFDPDCLTD